MTSERIKEIQEQTAYYQSVSVQQALLQVWNECEQEQLLIQRVSNNEAVLQYETCQRGRMTRCKCRSDQDCKKQSEVAYYCECDAPLVRTDVSGTEYCGICEWDIEQ